jgi:hypothetical protein
MPEIRPTQRVDNTNVKQTLPTRRFRFLVLPYAIGEIDDLRSNLVPVLERLGLGLVLMHDCLFDIAVPSEGRIHRQNTFSADDLILRYFGLAEAAQKCRQTILGKRNVADTASGTSLNRWSFPRIAKAVTSSGSALKI